MLNKHLHTATSVVGMLFMLLGSSIVTCTLHNVSGQAWHMRVIVCMILEAATATCLPCEFVYQ